MSSTDTNATTMSSQNTDSGTLEPTLTANELGAASEASKFGDTPVSDCPHVQRLMAKLLCKLNKVTSHKQKRNKKKTQFSLLWQDYIGRSTSAHGARSFETPHNMPELRKGVGVYMRSLDKSSKASWLKELWVIARELLLEIDPTFAENDDWVETTFSGSIGPLQDTDGGGPSGGARGP